MVAPPTPPRPSGSRTARISCIADRLTEVKRLNYALAINAATTHRHDYITAYVNDLGNVIDFAPLAGTTLKLAVDPLGGAGVYYWPRIAEKYLPELQILNRYVDPTFRFMTLDWDGRIRMDCSSPYAMASHDREQGQVSTWPGPAIPTTIATAS